MSQERGSLFTKRHFTSLLWLLFYLALSVSLLLFDINSSYVKAFRTSLIQGVLSPIQAIIAIPNELGKTIGGYFSNIDILQNQNSILQKKLLEATADRSRINELILENKQFRNLSRMKEKLPVESELVKLLAFTGDPFMDKLLINKGFEQGVIAGSPILDSRGVLGQVTKVFANKSEVTLITDNRFMIPSMVARTGLRAIIGGHGKNKPLTFFHVLEKEDIVAGDLIVTSGLDDIFPLGVPVAKITYVQQSLPQDHPMEVRAAPVAKVALGTFAVLLKPASSQTQSTDQKHHEQSN